MYRHFIGFMIIVSVFNQPLFDSDAIKINTLQTSRLATPRVISPNPTPSPSPSPSPSPQGPNSNAASNLDNSNSDNAFGSTANLQPMKMMGQSFITTTSSNGKNLF